MGFQDGFSDAYKNMIMTILERGGIIYENGKFVTLSAEDEELLKDLRKYNII